jgi:hypothetical protein
MDFQGSLFAPITGELDLSGLTRTSLSAGAWVDVAAGWLPEADEVFDAVGSGS